MEEEDQLTHVILDSRNVTNPSLHGAYPGGPLEYVFDSAWKTPFSRLNVEQRAAVIPADRRAWRAISIPADKKARRTGL
ncbi:hypothetical protein K2P56_00965 [Patescibacteria group bacterium]|nr:hypothetical protein [Patescibacteria group bacterium]